MAAGFGIVEGLWPSVRGQRRLRKGVLTDLMYFLYTALFGRLFTGIVVGVSILILGAILGVPLTADQLRGISERETAIGSWPLGLQLVSFIVLADFLGYWQHRAFHSFARLWRFHAVHHSSTEVDWLSSVRVHPLNDAIAATIVASPLLLAGFTPAALASYLPFLTLYAITLHANVGWDYGPLRNAITSPTFHRWHDAAEEQALNKNFAGLLPLWDILFGTLYFPKGEYASHFGVVGDAVPNGFLPQLVYPFRPQKSVEAAH